jgi:hypothetical protein
LVPKLPLASRQNLFCLFFQFCWRESIRDNKKEIAFLLAWDKDSSTERFLALLPCTCLLQPKLVHLYQSLHYFLVTSQSGLCQFNVTILAPLQQAHQTLSSFRFLILSLLIYQQLTDKIALSLRFGTWTFQQCSNCKDHRDSNR